VTPADRAAIDAGVVARTALLLLAKDGAEKASADAFRPLTPVEAARFGARTISPDPTHNPNKSPTGKRTTKGKTDVGSNVSAKVAGLAETARRILDAVVPPALGAAAQEVADRWIATLSPVEPVLVRSAAAPRRRPSPAPKPGKRR
jgi:hypothetical protein